MKKRMLSLALCGAMVATMFAGCGDNSASTGSSENVDTSGELTWKIGGIGPTTGGAAQYGQGVMNAIQIAVDEVNAAGGINGYQVAFNFQDDEADPQKAVNAYNTLKDWGMQILEGTVTSGACAAVSAETYNDRIFQITPSASSTSVTEGHDNTFQICFSDPNQGTVSADYIAENGLGSKIGIIYDSSDPYSTGVYQNFATEAANVGLEIVATEAFTADSKTDFTTQLQKCKDAEADLLFLPFYYTEGSIVLTQANKMGYEPTMFGVDGFDGLLGVENFDVSLAEGVYLLTPFAADAEDEATQSFVSKYEEQYGGTPNQFAADAYDGIYILKEALESANLTPEASNEEICEALIAAIQEVNYDGLTGEGMTWNAAGEVSKSPKAVIIQDGGYVSVQ
ncbi:branched-chain amino acid transport system substrate-binding protein [Pseudobutyrivibrio sp. JW11]|uniref:ABC transporter substrate-binding protein n=1 Tax=Pseudobutyrivibrio TaxID=46205 RepID=UPI0008EAFF07|nr:MULTISPECIES: ABC transporter substrate-binding protein [Pseudobutyrivibrio]MBE5914668.1 ABC transporter substrate-binding protein [Pseudobutyrivibrio ruminis]SFO53159.1 branched-chain amino acid transport system substrate-binding protein [Pseudobutyrivibrio sp. JW11]